MKGAGVVLIEMPRIALPENMYNLSYNSRSIGGSAFHIRGSVLK